MVECYDLTLTLKFNDNKRITFIIPSPRKCELSELAELIKNKINEQVLAFAKEAGTDTAKLEAEMLKLKNDYINAIDNLSKANLEIANLKAPKLEDKEYVEQLESFVNERKELKQQEEQPKRKYNKRDK